MNFPPKITWSAIVLFVLLEGPAPAQDEAKPQADAAAELVAVEGFSFDNLAYGDAGNAPAARARLEAGLELQLDLVDRVCTLSPAQNKKLLLAGKGEIKRFFDEVEDLRRRMETLKSPAPDGRPQQPDRFQPIIEALTKLPLAGGRGSFAYAPLFRKICKATLTPEQAARYRADRLAAREFADRARVKLVIEIFDAIGTLTHDQRVKLTELVTQETRRLRRFGTSPSELLLVVSVTSRIPEAKIKPLLRDDQWKPVHRVMDLWKQGTEADMAVLEALPPDPDADLDAAAPLAEPAGP